jgi:putative addiction module component (TIGR02574 family)
MSKETASALIASLPLDERLALLEAVCDSLVDGQRDVPVSDKQRELIRQRVAAYRADPRPGTPLAQALEQIRAARS